MHRRLSGRGYVLAHVHQRERQAGGQVVNEVVPRPGDGGGHEAGRQLGGSGLASRLGRQVEHGTAGHGQGVDLGEQPTAVFQRPIVGRPHQEIGSLRPTGEQREDVRLPVGDVGELGRAGTDRRRPPRPLDPALALLVL